MTKNEIEAAFAACKTVENCKEAFTRLYPSIRTGAQMDNFYRTFTATYKRCGNVHSDAKGKVYKGKTLMPAQSFGGLVGAIYTFCPGVNLSVSGQVLTASGNTKANKDLLKSLGLFWDKYTKVWKYYTCKATFLQSTLPITNAAVKALAK